MCCLSAGCQLRHWPNQSVSHRSVYPYSANQPHPPTPLPALDLCATGGLTPPSTFWPALIMSRDKSCLIVITEAVTQEHRSAQTTHWNQIYSRRRKAAALLMLVFITCWLSVRINSLKHMLTNYVPFTLPVIVRSGLKKKSIYLYVSKIERFLNVFSSYSQIRNLNSPRITL